MLFCPILQILYPLIFFVGETEATLVWHQQISFGFNRDYGLKVPFDENLLNLIGFNFCILDLKDFRLNLNAEHSATCQQAKN
jgi:hypothetical protein